ncbi:glucoamylase precursor [Delitschia confertaspora ATCC 74209]|uniref:Glucoamylase n=1 Tax=Delitschia confertaspora ATCC 74209 TaxID=1513339 RepID=A0A9P4JEF4_9PLEO|nr:glucoamylase precursor [Delitschia confertaspora ATCC 74209]
MIFRGWIATLVATTISGTIAAPSLAPRNDYLQRVLDNIGPNGKQVPGASAGVIIASPSTQDPDYFFTWTRDAALTMKMLVDEFLHGNAGLRSYLQAYVKSQAILQTVSNPSGALSSGRGLGEPKFYANLTRYNGAWGRPQRDGPALRATALITYANWLLNTRTNANLKEVKEQVWPVVKNDLAYVGEFWNSTGFDLWEEVSGSSFFATAAQHRALVEGAALAKRLGQNCAACESQAPNVLCFLQTYWNGKYVVANINTGVQRSGVDANTLLGSIATFDPAATCSDTLFQPCSARALSNLKTYVDAFRTLYTINSKTPKTSPVATGRYAEDIYYNGNPWYLTTLAVAEQLYLAIQTWSTVNVIEINALSLPFWKDVYPAAKIGTISKRSNGKNFNKLLDAVLDYADGFVAVVHQYTPASGALSEQFDRNTGAPLSARDLTWSYAAYITALSARRSATSNYPQVPSWNAPKVPKIPSTCSASSAKGTYVPATGAGAPPGQGGCTVLIAFNLNATTYYGENIYLTGNVTELGNWRTSDSIPGDAGGYTSERPLWKFEVELPENEVVGYGYLRLEDDGEWLKETANRTVSVPKCGASETVTVQDAWVGPTGIPS